MSRSPDSLPGIITLAPEFLSLARFLMRLRGIPAETNSIPVGFLPLLFPSLRYSRNICVPIHTYFPRDGKSAGFPPSPFPCRPLLCSLTFVCICGSNCSLLTTPYILSVGAGDSMFSAFLSICLCVHIYVHCHSLSLASEKSRLVFLSSTG